MDVAIGDRVRESLYFAQGDRNARMTGGAQIYIENMKDALPDKERISEAKNWLEKRGVKYVLSCWVDLLGVPKTKPIPLSDFEALCAGKGPQFAVHSVSMVPDLGPADSDQIPIPDLDSLLICPWNHEHAWVFADLYWEDRPYNVCPRHALKRQVQSALGLGLRPMAGIEPEFIAMRYDGDGRAVKAFDVDPVVDGRQVVRRQAWGYDVEASLDSMAFLGELIDTLERLQWDIHDVVAEGAYSQFELDFGYTNVLDMADRYTFLRVLLKEVAKKHGMFITFMPKPTLGDWRSGAHINYSMQDAKNGQNLFEKNGDFSEICLHAVGGLLRHGGALAAVSCSTVNSYKGLVAQVPGFEGGVFTWAPTHVTYGRNNRSAMLRLPQNRFCIENRATDMCMNGYLALGMTVGATLKGVTEKLDAGTPLNRDLYKMTSKELDEQGIQRLPRNLMEAIEIFDSDDLAKEVLGDVMHSSYSSYKHDEWNRFSVAITDWERNEYLRFF